jgi:AAA+ ATPase superfamily predicted ATPase
MAVKTINRQREISQLQGLAGAPPGLVILSGRRRVGKSFLLRVALTGDRVVHFQAEEQPRPLQLAAFARECSELVAGAPLAFGSWEDAFSFLDGQAKSAGPLVTILDEFQYLAQRDAGLVSAVQKWWDRWDHENTPILLVLSGSALTFMAGLLSGAKPTHGRSVYRPFLQPLDYRDAAAFAPKSSSPVELVERYAVLGGTPQYQRWAGDRPLGKVIRDVILSPDAPLHRDPEHLIREEDEIREPGPYFGTLEAIADGYTKPGEIAGRLDVGTPLMSAYLKRLQALAYATKVEPLEPRGKGRSRAYWKIADPYFRFWFRYVLPNSSRLARGRIEQVARQIERQLPTYVGGVFEDICRDWVGRISPLGSSADEIGSWWNRKSDVEIDVVGVDKKGYTILGACKWWKDPVGENVLDDLITARGVLGAKASRAELAIFSKVGFNEKLTNRAKREGVHLIVSDELFK